jgi:uncharacterized membrane protein YraQ (UPF0718 family)
MIETFKLFSAIALAIFIEAMPFLVIGALFSAIIEVFISTERLLRIVPKNIVGGLALGISAGFVLPTCECGVVPIVRRLMHKGVPPYIAIAYMLAAPIVNPVVLASTYIAFRGSFTMMFARIALAILVAAIVGLIARRLVHVAKTKKHTHHVESFGHNHEHHDHEHHHDHSNESFLLKIRSGLTHAATEFMDMAKFLILGALIAAAFKTFLPANIMAVFSGSLPLSILGMMILAFLLSICSEADAFVAASFMGFPVAAQLAFIGIGPMLDLKLIGMYSITFQRKMVVVLLVVPFVLIFVVSWLIGSLNILSF